MHNMIYMQENFSKTGLYIRKFIFSYLPYILDSITFLNLYVVARIASVRECMLRRPSPHVKVK